MAILAIKVFQDFLGKKKIRLNKKDQVNKYISRYKIDGATYEIEITLSGADLSVNLPHKMSEPPHKKKVPQEYFYSCGAYFLIIPRNYSAGFLCV